MKCSQSLNCQQLHRGTLLSTIIVHIIWAGLIDHRMTMPSSNQTTWNWTSKTQKATKGSKEWLKIGLLLVWSVSSTGAETYIRRVIPFEYKFWEDFIYEQVVRILTYVGDFDSSTEFCSTVNGPWSIDNIIWFVLTCLVVTNTRTYMTPLPAHH